MATSFKRPESVLVVVHTTALECLLLERLKPVGFWQSVTGSLEWEERAGQAARREMLEETGIEAGELIDADYSERFAILPQWRSLYAPDVTENVEHVFYWRLEQRLPVMLNPDEHSRYQWLGVDQALQRVDSWTNRQAIERLKARIGGCR